MAIDKDDHKKLVKNLQTKLLDLSRKNNLINYKFGVSRNRPNIRIVDEIPDLIYKKIKKDKPLFFKGIQRPQVKNIPDENTKEFKKALAEEIDQDQDYQKQLIKFKEKPNKKEETTLLDSLKDRVRSKLKLQPVDRTIDAKEEDEALRLKINTSEELSLDLKESENYTDNSLQTLLFEDDLERQLSRIHHRTKLFESELGVNTLFLVFGFLEWYESDHSTEVLASPLLILPVQIKQEKGDDGLFYSIQYFEEEPVVNLSLKEKLKIDFNIDLPDFSAFSEKNTTTSDLENGPTPTETQEDFEVIKKYLLHIEKLIQGQKQWRILKRLNLSVLSFQKISLYKDLGEYQSANPQDLVLDLMSSKDTLDTSFEQDYDLESSEMLRKIPPIVTDADSSQISAIIDSLEGKNLVVEGPPGTGKSQTITNMISALINQGKKVLFVAEKKAALGVVKKRLDKVGMGNFSLELHSNKVRKSQVIESIRSSLAERRTDLYSPVETENIDRREMEIREKTNEYIRFITQEKELSEKHMIRDLIGKFLKLQNNHPDLLNQTKDFINSESIKNKSLVEIGQLKYDLREIASVFSLIRYPAYKEHPLYLTAQRNIKYQDQVQLVTQLRDKLNLLKFKTNQVSELPLEGQSLIELNKTLSAISQIPVAEDLDVSLFEESVGKEYLQSVKSLLTKIVGMQQDLIVFKKNKSDAVLKDLLSKDFEKDLSTLIQKLEEIKFYGNLDSLSEESGLLSDTIEFFDDNLKDLDSMVKEVIGYQDNLSSDEFRLLIMFLDEISKIGSSHLKVRKDDLFDEEYQSRVLKAYSKKELVEEILTGLAQLVEVEKIPTDHEIRRIHAEMEGSGILFKFTPTYFKIKKQVKNFSLNKSLNFKQIFQIVDKLNSLQKLRSFIQGLNVVDEVSVKGLGLIQKQHEFISSFNKIKAGLNQKSFSRKTLSSLRTIDSDGIDRLKEFSNHSKMMKSSLSYLTNRLLTEEVSLLKEKQKKMREISQFLIDKNIALDNDVSELKSLISRAQNFCLTYSDIYAGPLAKRLDLPLDIDKVNVLPIRKLIQYRDSVDSLNLPFEVYKELFNNSFITNRLSIVKRLSEEILLILGELIEIKNTNDHFPLNLSQSVTSNLTHILDYIKYSEDLSLLLKIKNKVDSFKDRSLQIEEIVNSLIELRYDESNIGDVVDVWHLHSIVKESSIAANMSDFSGDTLDNLRKEYQDLDELRLKNNSLMIKHNILMKPLPYAKKKSNKVSEKEGVDLINHLLNKPGSRVSLREFLLRSGSEILEIMPCFMMSPLSVAQFLPQESFHFDVLIIDEASQVKIEDILSSVIRAKQIIVVGDNKQLPPTSFFQSEDMNEDDTDTDYESILDMTEKAFSNKRRLKWHYRSRNEKLIKFSNSYFYDDDLILFPSSNNEGSESGLVPVFVNGTYENNKNKKEADLIVEQAIDYIKRNPDKSIGLVAINKAQADYIQDLFDEKAKSEPLVQEYLINWEDKEEFFVKNLENVQGDERDAIFISLVYGFDSDGNFFNRFGPINSDKGHRRLNVLFSRAKHLMKVFYSIPEEEINSDSSSKEGVKCLKSFVKFLNTGILGSSHRRFMGKTTPQTSVFEDYVLEALQQEGYTVDRQVGESGYFIDLAIKDPKTNAYLLGIECDGRTYHSSKFMRDRDKTRQMILERLGWKMARIWSTDWFKDPKRELSKIHLILDRVKKQSD